MSPEILTQLLSSSCQLFRLRLNERFLEVQQVPVCMEYGPSYYHEIWYSSSQHLIQ